MNDFLQFYGANQISPVSQNLDDLELHFGRRTGLYRTLGLAASLFEGRDILEVAPGSGHNSIVTATFKARRYDLVEPNPTGFEKLVGLFEEYKLRTDSIRFFNTRLDNFPEKGTYDVVICEGLIPGLSDQDAFLPQLAGKVRKGGILVVTCADAVSVFFETLRRYLARLLVYRLGNASGTQDGDRQSIRILLPAFQSHLNALIGMSRPAEDWIWDNLLNPAATSLAARHEFSIERCLNHLGNDFYFYGSSPVFLENWNWYKNLPAKPHDYNNAFAESFASQRHNLLHYEETCVANRAASESMYQHCRMFSSLLEERVPPAWTTITSETIDQDLICAKSVREIARRCGLQRSDAAIKEFLALFDDGRIPDAQTIAEMTAFRGAFGRGQQYLSLVKA